MKTLLVVLCAGALIGLGVWLGPKAFPPEPPKPLILPGKTDTLVVERETIRQIIQEKVRPVFVSDTVLLTDTLLVTDVDTLDELRDRFYINSVAAGLGRGDTLLVAGSRLGYTAGTLTSQDYLQRFIQPGPVRAVVADSSGFRADFYDPPEVVAPCEFGCKAKYAGYGALGLKVAELLVRVIAP